MHAVLMRKALQLPLHYVLAACIAVTTTALCFPMCYWQCMGRTQGSRPLSCMALLISEPNWQAKLAIPAKEVAGDP